MTSTSTQSSTTSSGLNSKQAQSTVDQLLKGVSTAYSDGSTYTAPGSTTTSAQSAALDAANNPLYSSGVNSALSGINSVIGSGGLTDGQSSNLSDQNALASLYGSMALDPASTIQGQNLIKDVTQSTNSSFNNSGLFGSDSNQRALSQGLTEGLGNLQNSYLQGQQSALSSAFDMGQQGTTNISSLSQLYPTLYQAAQLPSSTALSIGSAQDTAAQNEANQNLTLLSNLSSILNGTANLGGTTSTTTSTSPSTNPLLGLLGLGIGLL